MKTNKLNPKSFLLVSSLVVMSSFNSFAQNGIIWTNTQNVNDLDIHYENDKIFSGNEKIQTLIEDYSINKIEKAVPSSRRKSLQNLVEITCNCDETDLLIAVSKLNEIFEQPEIGPHYETLFTPDDYSTAFPDDYALNLINAEKAWDITHGDSSIIIAVSDENFQITHEELIGKIHNYDATNTAATTHGTAVAVTAAGNTNNGIGKSSIGYDSELALYRMSYNDLITATYSGYRVMNVSWASGCIQSNYIQNVIDEIYDNGSIIVAAAGNGGTCGGPSNLVYPAACEHVIAVTGIGVNDNHEIIPGDTNITFQHNHSVDISAPGIAVPLTIGSGNYLTGNGTSFSAPFVSGTIALMLSVDSCLTFEDVETILYSTSVDIDSLNPAFAGRLGAGRLDAGAAVLMASTYMSCGSEPSDPIVDPIIIDTHGDHTVIHVSQGSLAGIDENDNINNEFTVYPNPAIAGAAITLKSQSTINNCEVLNLNGAIVELVETKGNEMHISNLSKGTYFLNVNFEDGTKKRERLIIF